MTKSIFTDKTVLITGGTGSFGGAFVKYLLNTDVGAIHIFSRDENKQHHMRQNIRDERMKYLIGDVRDFDSVRRACKNVDYLFHAAALKQVPSCEFFPMQAIQTNVLGSDHVIHAALEVGVKRAVFLSTDKAVFPINAMGMSKALMEKTVKSRAREASPDDTVLSLVRYGNVMCSRGSVIEVFIDQILNDRPITITTDDMTRFMMSLDDAIHLVEYALGHARQGDMFIHKAPACRIIDLARVLLKMFNAKNPIKTIGIRHGEKIHEMLASSAELTHAEDLKQYYRIPNDTRGLDYKQYYTEGSVSDSPSDLGSNTVPMMNDEELEAKLRSIDYVQEALSRG